MCIVFLNVRIYSYTVQCIGHTQKAGPVQNLGKNVKLISLNIGITRVYYLSNYIIVVLLLIISNTS